MFATLQGRYEEAGLLYERSLAIREKALGPDHPGVAQSLNNRAGLLGIQVAFWKHCSRNIVVETL